MKRFFSTLALFAFFPSLYLGFNYIYNTQVSMLEPVKLGDKRVLIIGDSHPERSINPKLLSSAINISQPAEPLVASFWKLKALLPHNQLDTVILGLAPHNLSGFNDFKFQDQKWSDEMFRRYYAIGDFKEIGQSIPVDEESLKRIELQQTLFYPKLVHDNFIGEFADDRKSNNNDWQSPVSRHYYRDSVELGISAVALNHVDSIIALTEKHQVTLVVVSNPLQINYYSHIPPKFLQAYEDLLSSLPSNILVYDATKRNYEHDLFFNPDHLNSKGAEVFTRELNQFFRSRQRHGLE